MNPSKTISHEIAVSLRSDILRGRYHSGERLPSERDLAVRFDTSRGAAREGFSQLEQMGLIQVLPGGARVQPIETASLAVLGPLLELSDPPDPQLVDQVLEAYGFLAALTVRSAVEKASQEELNQLHQLVVNLAKQPRDLKVTQPFWRELLEALVKIADNLVVRLIGNDLRAQFLDYMMDLGIKPNCQRKIIDQTLESLKRSFTSRNSELASSALQTHFDELRNAAASARNSGSGD